MLEVCWKIIESGVEPEKERDEPFLLKREVALEGSNYIYKLPFVEFLKYSARAIMRLSFTTFFTFLFITSHEI